jgi:hypothetical protein
VTDRTGAQSEVTLSYRRVGWTVLRVLVSAAVVVTVYYLLPFDRAATWGAVTLLVIGLVALIALIGFQVRAIIRSPFPNLRAAEPWPSASRCSCCCSPAPTSSWPGSPPAASAAI